MAWWRTVTLQQPAISTLKGVQKKNGNLLRKDFKRHMHAFNGEQSVMLVPLQLLPSSVFRKPFAWSRALDFWGLPVCWENLCRGLGRR